MSDRSSRLLARLRGSMLSGRARLLAAAGAILISASGRTGRYEVWVGPYRPRLSAVSVTVGLAVTVAGLLIDSDRSQALRETKEKLDDTTADLARATKKVAKLTNQVGALKDRVARVEQARDDAEGLLREVADSTLVTILEEISLPKTARISLFVATATEFQLVARYSQAPSRNVRGRGHYPLDHGALGIAWRRGEAVIKDLPDPTARNRYIDRQVKCGVRPEFVRRFTMASRAYTALTVASLDGDHSAGVVVVETEEPETIPIHSLREALNMGAVRRQLARVLHEQLVLVDDPDLPRTRGY